MHAGAAEARMAYINVRHIDVEKSERANSTHVLREESEDMKCE